MTITGIKIDEIWFDFTDRGELLSVLYFVIDNPVSQDILKSFLKRLQDSGSLTSEQLPIATRLYHEYIESSLTVG